MLVKLAAVVLLSLTLAQAFPSCGGGSEGEILVIGYVEAKRLERAVGAFYLVINSHEYDVPEAFWRQVDLGDLVRWDGLTWTVVRRAGAIRTPVNSAAPFAPS